EVFDNNVEVQALSAAGLQALMNAAAAAAHDAVATPTRAEALLGGSLAELDEGTATGFIRRFGARAYRRPLTGEEVAAYLALWRSEGNPLDGVRMVLRTFLASPHFLFRPEVGNPDPDKPGYARLSAHERATRLSYLLLGTTPADDLLEAAASGALESPDGVETLALRMLEAPAGRRYRRWFFANWLGINDALSLQFGGLVVENDSAQAHLDMAEQAYLLFDDFMAPGRRLLDALVAPYTYLTPALAPIYGVDAAGRQNWWRADMAGTPRLGFLTQPAMLAITGQTNSPAIARGKFIRERLLCERLPPPPPGIPALPADSFQGSERERLATHRQEPLCNGCHRLMEPIGFGFEQFDVIGNFVTRDRTGTPLTGEGAVVGEREAPFSGVADLATLLRASPQVQRCAGEKLVEYLLGRTPREADEPLVQAVGRALEEEDFAAAV
ncbi:MAG TPA: DUF1588 domain-containing protein, partial [Myxococcota bacterium]|nr:DUF1588 domain-containing protein [Myxococcota bacterium]